MVLEIAQIDVLPGQEDGFAAAYAQARPILAETEGCLTTRMTRGVESPSHFVLLVEWESVEAHVENFRNTDRFTRWRTILSPFFAKPPFVEHYTDVAGE